MKKIYEYSHLGGAEILKVRYPAIDNEIDQVITEITAKRLKISKEKTMKGKKLFSPKNMNEQFRQAFHKQGFKELRDTYTITIPNYKKEISNAYKQIDFVKEKVLVEVQFGKYAFMFYDMAKFQYFLMKIKPM